MPELRYFDCFAAIGRRAGKDPEAPWRTETLLAEMERCQVHGALIFAHQAAEIHPGVGNPLVLETCAEHPRLYPCWVGLPHQTGEFPPPEKLVEEMLYKGVRALKLYPRTFNFAVNEETLGELLAALQEAGLLLILERGEYGTEVQVDWEELAWLCATYPRLPVLLHRVRWEATRRLLPLAERHENLHFEFSNYQGNRMLEFWCERLSAERLLFGSGALEKSIGAARAYLDYAEISPEQRRAIAGGNLQRLLGLTDPPPDYPNHEPQDSLIAKALQGQPLDHIPVIDSHAHLLAPGTRGAAMIAMNAGDAPAVVARNRRLGVARTCVSSWTAIWGDYELGNRDTFEAMRQFPNEIVGYAVLDPNYVTDWDAICRYYYERCGFRGMKPYFPRMRVPYNHAWFRPWWEYGNRHHLFALMHPSDNFEREMTDLAARYPNIRFLLAHSGGSWQTARQHVALAKRFANCFLEITFTSVTNGVIEFMVRELGAERVLYGSDAPMRDPAPQLGWVVYADLPEEDKRAILGGNMANILQGVRG